jgi:hypothetical protein
MIVSPENRMITDPGIVILEWSKVDNPSGVKYEVQVDNDATFTSPEFVNNKLKYCSVKTSYLEDDIYYWRVRATDRAGNISPWSQARQFWCCTQPPYAKTFGQQIHLVNNWDASDPTWQQLVSFLNADKTDSKDYSLFSFACGAFAEEVHNNAEAAGIRSAWAAVDFEDNSDGHALNAFKTTDKGLVYVDCTSSYRSDIKYPPVLDVGTGQVIEWKPERLPSHDKIAYVAIGTEYGQITLDKATSPEYVFYTAYMQRYNGYEQEVNAYNARAEVYMRLLGGRVFIYDQAEYARLKTMHDELENERVRLENIGGTFGAYQWEPLGIVENIKIYW